MRRCSRSSVTAGAHLDLGHRRGAADIPFERVAIGAQMAASQTEHAVVVKGSGVTLEGELTVPAHASAVVLFAHGSGSSRRSPRNRYVAGVLNDAGLGTLLIDLLTADEEREDEQTMKLRFDI